MGPILERPGFGVVLGEPGDRRSLQHRPRVRRAGPTASEEYRRASAVIDAEQAAVADHTYQPLDIAVAESRKPDLTAHLWRSAFCLATSRRPERRFWRGVELPGRGRELPATDRRFEDRGRQPPRAACLRVRGHGPSRESAPRLHPLRIPLTQWVAGERQLGGTAAGGGVPEHRAYEHFPAAEGAAVGWFSRPAARR